MLSNEQTSVFVYGTLKPGGYYHDSYCGEFDFDAHKATTRGRLYNFPQLGYPGAVEDQTGIIHGFLFTFRHAEQAILAKLDYLESYDPSRPTEENEYYRTTVTVLDDSQIEVTSNAWCYFMLREKVAELNGIPIPDGDWKI